MGWGVGGEELTLESVFRMSGGPDQSQEMIPNIQSVVSRLTALA